MRDKYSEYFIAPGSHYGRRDFIANDDEELAEVIEVINSIETSHAPTIEEKDRFRKSYMKKKEKL